MSDFWDKNQDDELEAILNEVRGASAASDEDEKSEKEWSADDIDRLIAEAKGEEYIPAEPVKSDLDEKLKRFFGDELDTELFSVKPIEEEEEIETEIESEDISSGDEVEGQEMFFEKSEPVDDFDPELFSLETVFMPDSVPQKEEPKYNNAAPRQEESFPLPPNIVPEEKAEEKVEEKTEEEKVIDYRKKFFEKLNPEDIEIPNYDDKDPEYPFDKSGIVVLKNGAKTEDNLDIMPTVMAAEDARNIDEEKTKIMAIPGKAPVIEIPEPVDVEGQIILNDFVDIPEEARPEKAREEDVEESLWKRRKQKAKTFVLDDISGDGFSDALNNLNEDLPLETEEPQKISPKDTTKSILDSVGEYTDPAERNRIHSKLAEKVKSTTVSAIIIGVIDIIMIIVSLIPGVCTLLEMAEPDAVIICVINALLLIAAAAVDSQKIIEICSSVFKGKFSADTAIVVSILVAFIENCVSALLKGAIPVFGVVAVFAIFINKMTDLLNAKRVYDNFSVCAFSYENNLNAVHKLENESEIFELGRGLLMGNAEILYSSNIKFPANFIKNSEKNDEDNKYSLFLIIGSLVASLIAAVISALSNINAADTKASVLLGLSVFAAAVCLSAPVFGKFIPSFITFVTNKRLNKEGTVVTSIDAAEHIAASNAVVLDSADIFDRKSCTMHGMKDFKSMRIDVVLLYAAAMVIKSGGPLKECFEEVVDGRQDLLPPVKELVYEDKLGISARIYDQKVLLGNRNMLVHHNIKAPEKAFEDKYIHDGRKVIYLACNEQLAAMFVVSYSVDENIKGYLKLLEANGIQILVRTNDVNVTEELISSRFGLNPDNFKILSSVAGRLYKRRKDAVIDELPAELVHDGESTSMLKAIASCCTMVKKNKFGTFIQIAAMFIGIVFATLAGCGEAGITAIISVLIMLLESALVTGILFLDKK